MSDTDTATDPDASPDASPDPRIIRVLGFDPSFSHWGIAGAFYDITDGALTLVGLDTVHPRIHKLPGERQDAADLVRATSLAEIAIPSADAADVVIVEVPVGSQSARAAVGYGVCLGILATLQASGSTLIKITPAQAKSAATGDAEADKRAVIDAMYDAHPEGPWPTKTRKGVTSVLVKDAEHMADAVATVIAGIDTDAFRDIVTQRRLILEAMN